MSEQRKSPIDGLAYVLVSTGRLAEWRSFATEVLGLAVSPMPVARGFALRADDRLARMIVAEGDAEGITAVGWEVHGRDAWQALRAALTEHGHEYRELTREEARGRGVSQCISVTDPSGYAVEFCLAPLIEPVVPFVSPTGARFVTGDQGFGHVTQMVSNYEGSVDFYTEVLGFHVRETIDLAIRATFASCNARQHSVALIDGGSTSRDHHVMLEVDDIDTVGRALDKAYGGAARLTVGLGRHWNDKMISFYVETPSGFQIEYGFGGLRVDESRWTENAQGGTGGASVWGHHPVAALVGESGMEGFGPASQA